MDEAEELFLEAVSGGERYGPGRGLRVLSQTVAIPSSFQPKWSENARQFDYCLQSERYAHALERYCFLGKIIRGTVGSY